MEFKIDHLDPMGQGVSKSDTITFIKKTLPGETVSAKVIAKKKQVSFANLQEVLIPSSERISPACPHFNLCNGCDYLHTSYEKETEYKIASLKRHLFKFPQIPINFHPAPSRHHYRNRIQLHYDKKSRTLGFMGSSNHILEIPSCLLPVPLIAKKLSEIYLNKNQLPIFSPSSSLPPHGHVELYLPNQSHNEVLVAINQNYAHGGFTQVNSQMNQFMQNFINNTLTQTLQENEKVLDLFGGNGNLTQNIGHPTLVVDYYPPKNLPKDTCHQAFFSMDLYQKNAFKILNNELIKRNFSPQFIIFDPPRSGLKNVNDFISLFSPKGFAYIACEPTSFARDTLGLLKNYQLLSIDLFDFFPGTHHYETIGIFAKNNITV